MNVLNLLIIAFTVIFVFSGLMISSMAIYKRIEKRLSDSQIDMLHFAGSLPFFLFIIIVPFFSGMAEKNLIIKIIGYIFIVIFAGGFFIIIVPAEKLTFWLWSIFIGVMGVFLAVKLLIYYGITY